MILFKDAARLSLHLSELKKSGATISFVPTMGALHPGHLSLVTGANQKAGTTVCSIFVNPTQFNNPDDFNKYPIAIEKDIELLAKAGCDILFLPAVTEIYPPGYEAPFYDLGELEEILEGRYRPGHFQGVCQVVDRLLAIVDPDFLFMGQKDFQQCQVIRKLLSLTQRTSLNLIVSPTIREADGLAMSSRNMRLNATQRNKANLLFQTLSRAKDLQNTRPYPDLTAAAMNELTSQGFRVDYFEIADRRTLRPATEESPEKIALVAAYLDDIRLIDNLELN